MKPNTPQHDTVVIGWNEAGVVCFIRSYDNATQREEMMKQFNLVAETYDKWIIGSITDLREYLSEFQYED